MTVLLLCVESIGCLADGILPFWTRIFAIRTAEPTIALFVGMARMYIAWSCSDGEIIAGLRVVLRLITLGFFNNAIPHDEQKPS